MKQILLAAAMLLSLTAGAQTITTDGNTGSAVAPTEPKYLYFLDETCKTRIRADFSINKSATESTTNWFYEYEDVIDSSNKVWRVLNSGNFVTQLHFDDLKTALFRKTLDSTTLQKVDFQTSK